MKKYFMIFCLLMTLILGAGCRMMINTEPTPSRPDQEVEGPVKKPVNEIVENPTEPQKTDDPKADGPVKEEPSAEEPSETKPQQEVPIDSILPEEVEPAEPQKYEFSRDLQEVIEKDYSAWDNTTLSWWYHIPKPKYQGVAARINEDIAALIESSRAIWQVPPQEEKRVYLTMDEGYEFEENTTAILDTAKEKQVKIAFFVTGHFISSRPDLILRMYQEGHIVANHTNRHLNGPKALEESKEKFIDDIVSIESMYREITGSDLAPFMRPPEGKYSSRSLEIIKDLGYRPVFWSFAYKDWETDAQPDRKEAFDWITGQLHDGSVLLLHAVSKTNVDLLGDLIDYIRNQGYRIDTIDQIP